MKYFGFVFLYMYSMVVVAAPVTYEFKGIITGFGIFGSTASLPARLESGFNIGDSVSYLLVVDRNEPGFNVVDGVKVFRPSFENIGSIVERFFVDYISGDIVPFGGGHGYFTEPFTGFSGQSIFSKNLGPIKLKHSTRFDVSTGLSIIHSPDLNKLIDELAVGDSFELNNVWTSPSTGDPYLMTGDLVLSRITNIPLPAAIWFFGLGILGLIGVGIRGKA